MKTVLCFGDSNTWGYNAVTTERFGPSVRWPGVMREMLGQDFFVIEEGLNGRTTVWDDPIEEYKSGKKYLVPCLETHRPLDLVIIMLGTNDLKHRFALTAFDVGAGMENLIKIVLSSGAGTDGRPPKIMIISPAYIRKLNDAMAMFAGAQETSKGLAKYYSALADAYGCSFFDAASVAQTDVDGIHLDADAHRRLGLKVAELVKEILQ